MANIDVAKTMIAYSMGLALIALAAVAGAL